MRILFSVRKPANVRHYDSVLRELATRGHEIDLVKEHVGAKLWPPFVLALAEAHPNIRLSHSPSTVQNPWWELATRLRRARFYLRFFAPAYHDAPALLERARKRSPKPAVRLAEAPGVGARGRRLLARIVDALEQSTRSAALFHDYLRERRPDLVILTPLVVLKTTQLDIARAARELGIRSLFGVASWDHLSSKGELSFQPQYVTVWNDVQRREAVELHGIDADRIMVTGAQLFDEWFERRPSTTREEFCARVGLRHDKPIVLYVCSSMLEGSPPEPPFVMQWLRRLRESGHPPLEDCGILVRPHFQSTDAWQGVDVTDLDHAVCWPPLGDAPVDARSKADYFDSMYHAAAVVGINTSAMIEAAIVNRPIYTVELPEFRDSQAGTVHFHYLQDPTAPLLRSSRTLEEHTRALAEVLNGRDPEPDRSARFVRNFVRPGPASTPATLRFVESVEAVGARPAPAPVPAPIWTRIIRPFLWPSAQAARRRAIHLEEESLRLKALRRQQHQESKRLKAEERRLQRYEAKRQGGPAGVS